MKNKKSSGSNGISNEILKCCSPVVDEHLCKAFNECLKVGIFPECLKSAKVIALHKKGEYSDRENYRPISLLSSLSKVFEKLLYTRMISFLLRMIFSLQYNSIFGLTIRVFMQLVKLPIIYVMQSTKKIRVKRALSISEKLLIPWTTLNCLTHCTIMDSEALYFIS